jgi:hypothetical protein
MNYFERVESSLRGCSEKHLRLSSRRGLGYSQTGWDNAKAKACARHMPRGKAYRVMSSIDRTKRYMDIISDTSKILRSVRETYAVDDILAEYLPWIR